MTITTMPKPYISTYNPSDSFATMQARVVASRAAHYAAQDYAAEVEAEHGLYADVTVVARAVEETAKVVARNAERVATVEAEAIAAEKLDTLRVANERHARGLDAFIALVADTRDGADSLTPVNCDFDELMHALHSSQGLMSKLWISKAVNTAVGTRSMGWETAADIAAAIVALLT